MATLTVTRTLPEPAADVWARIGDFARPEWLPGARLVSLEGEGPGAVRVLAVPPDVRLTETLLAAGERTLSWAMTGPSPLPVRDHVTTIEVIEAEAGAEVRWTAAFVADGMSDAAAEAMMRQMITSLLSTL